MGKSVRNRAVIASALFVFLSAELFGQAPNPINSPAARYLQLLKLLSAKQYESAWAEARGLIEQAPQFEFTYGKAVAVAQGLGQLERAEIFFNELLAQTPHNPRAYYGLALVYRNRGEPEKLIAKAQQCITELPEFTPAYRVLADVYLKQKRFTEAESYFSELTQTNPVAFYGLGYLYSKVEKWPEALAALTRSPGLFDRWRLTGEIYFNTANYDEALKVFQNLLPETIARGEIERQVRIQIDFGSTNVELGNHWQARDLFKEALHAATEMGDPVLQEYCLLKLGHSYQRQASYQLALSHWLQGLALARANRSKSNEGLFLGNIGLIYQWFGNLPQAVEYTQQAVQFLQAPGDAESQALFLTNLGWLYTELREFAEAVKCFNMALEITRRIAQPDRESAALTGLANLHFVQQDYQAALSVHLSALALARKVHNPQREGVSLNYLGALHLKLANPQAALRCHEEALELGQQFDLPRMIWQAHGGLATVYEQQGVREKAQVHYRQAIEALERVRALFSVAEEKAGFFQDKVEVYKRLIAVMLPPADKAIPLDKAAEVFYVAERSRARALADLLMEAAVSPEQNLNLDLLSQRQELQHHIASLNAKLLREKAAPVDKQNQPALARLERELSKADGDLADWVRKVRADNPRYAELRYPEPAKLEQAQELLDAQTLLLAYTLSEQESYLFAVTQKGLRVLRLPGAARLNGLVERLLAALTNREETSEDHRPLAGELYRALIAPVDRAGLLAKKTRLIVVADGALHRLPFEVLKPTGKRLYLVERLAISYAPSASVLVNLKNMPRPTESGQKPFIAFAAPQYDLRAAEPSDSVLSAVTRAAGGGQRWNFAPLRFSDREAQAIANLFGQEALVFTGAQASEENVKVKDRLQQYRLVHFSAHGLVNEQRPRFSSLVLSLRPSVAGPVAGSDAGPVAGSDAANKPAVGEDGLLSAYEIFSLKLKADLVTLSACETALGKEVKGEGLMSLVRAFMYAGTPSVLASLWKVDDEGTAKLMVEFYRNLTQGTLKNGKRLTKAEALQRAQVDAIKQGRAPYYWAPFVLLGQAD